MRKLAQRADRVVFVQVICGRARENGKSQSYVRSDPGQRQSDATQNEQQRGYGTYARVPTLGQGRVYQFKNIATKLAAIAAI